MLNDWRNGSYDSANDHCPVFGSWLRARRAVYTPAGPSGWLGIVATLKIGTPEVGQPQTASALRTCEGAASNAPTSSARSAILVDGVVRRMSSILSRRDRGVGERQRGGGIRVRRAVERAGEECQ